MKKLYFFLAKLGAADWYLSTRSGTFEEVARMCEGKTLAVVGNARKLADMSQGDEIDRADIVVRLNRAPMQSPASHGVRTDWIATSTTLDAKLLEERQPDLVLWMTSRRKRLSWLMVNRQPIFINPLAHHKELLTELAARPTTGLLLLSLLRRTSAAEIRIYGFDFFVSQSLSGSRRAKDVSHDFDAERVWVQRAVLSDQRFTFNAIT